MEFSKIQVLIYHQDFCLLSLEHVCAIFSSLQINMNFTCRIFPLSCFCEKKEKRKIYLHNFFHWAPQFVQSTYYVKMRGWLAREYVNKKCMKYILNKGIIFLDGVSVEKLCETSWTDQLDTQCKQKYREKSF